METKKLYRSNRTWSILLPIDMRAWHGTLRGRLILKSWAAHHNECSRRLRHSSTGILVMIG